jgi:hypothetical protein
LKGIVIEQLIVTTPFDEATLEKMKQCTKVEFPICLSEAMLKMFGVRGKKSLDSIVMNETFENTQISSAKDIWNLYEKYIERAANLLGDDVAQVIEFETLKEMKAMLCTKCPLFERGIEKQIFSGRI